MAATVQTDKQGDLVSGTPFDLGSTQTGKAKSRVPEILVGTFLVALFALAGAWFYSTSTSRTGWVALRMDVERGSVITREQLTTFELNTDAELRGIAASQITSIVGEIALVDMRAGTLITDDQFASEAPIPAGFGLVGLELSPGEFPTLSLRSGDWVRLVLLPEGEFDPTPGGVPVLDERVEVAEVVGEAGAGRFISVLLPTDVADLVVVAHANDRVRLIQVPGELSE